jgi:cyanophycinase
LLHILPEFINNKKMNAFENSIINNYKKGYLVLIGGAEDKKDKKVILRKIVELNNAKTVVVIPSASEYPEGIADDYVRAFSSIGVEKIMVFDIRNKSEADKSEYFEKIISADMIFFTGGDQLKLTNTFLDTCLLEKIKEKYLSGTTIAGTSAGAAAACDPIIFDGDDSGLCKGTIHHSRGFGFVRNITIDTHFISRGRLGRLSQFLSSGLSTKGIGIGEDTAIVIDSNYVFEVIGSGMVTIVNTDEISYSNYDEISDNSLIVINDILVGFLQRGSSFDMVTWKVISSTVSNETNSMKVEISIT